MVDHLTRYLGRAPVIAVLERLAMAPSGMVPSLLGPMTRHRQMVKKLWAASVFRRVLSDAFDIMFP